MDIFGFTATDTALSVLGLNTAQIITDFIFLQTPLATLAFAAGLIVSIIQTTQTGNYRPLIIFFLIFVSVALCLLPKRPEGTIKSALEHYTQSAQSSQALKDQILDYHYIPVLLSFLGQMMDAIMTGFIHAFDSVMPAWAHYLTAPFGLQRNCLNIKEIIEKGIGDISLRRKLNAFLYDQYVPALIMLRHDDPTVDFNALWPGHAGISSYYSPDGNKQWQDIKRQLKNYLDLNPDLAKSARIQLSNLTQSSPQEVEEALLKSIVQNELNAMNALDTKGHGLGLWRQACSWMMSVFPCVYGSANLILYALCPLVILAMYINHRLTIVAHYLKMLVWVKSLGLGGALSFYASLLMARMQAQGVSGDPSWAWHYPYFCVSAVILLGLMPVITFFMINHGGKEKWGT